MAYWEWDEEEGRHKLCHSTRYVAQTREVFPGSTAGADADAKPYAGGASQRRQKGMGIVCVWRWCEVGGGVRQAVWLKRDVIACSFACFRQNPPVFACFRG